VCLILNKNAMPSLLQKVAFSPNISKTSGSNVFQIDSQQVSWWQ